MTKTMAETRPDPDQLLQRVNLFLSLGGNFELPPLPEADDAQVEPAS